MEIFLQYKFSPYNYAQVRRRVKGPNKVLYKEALPQGPNPFPFV